VSASAAARLGSGLRRLLFGGQPLELNVGPAGPIGPIGVPNAGDGRWQVGEASGRSCLAPDERSHYLYFTLPADARARAGQRLWVEVEYRGARYGEFRLQYASRRREQPDAGLYEAAPQRWQPGDAGLERFRRALFVLEDFDGERTQNQEASFRLEFRRDLRVAGLRVHFELPADAEAYTELAPLPELRKLPGRAYPLNYLFIEITNACNFKCTWCPDEVMDRRRGFMKKEKVFRILDEVAEKRERMGPLYPVKLHQMGEPFLHPDLPEIVGHAEQRGVPIELNTNCGLITAEIVDALYAAGLTNLILSYQTPDLESFRTRKAPRLAFDDYRDKVRLAVERKVATGARTRIEIDIMNTKHSDGFRIVSEEEQALAFVRDWIEFSQSLERQYGLEPRPHDWDRIREVHVLDQDEDGSRYELLDGVSLIWKRCHSWGNTMGEHQTAQVVDTYCPAPYDQLVIQWNGDVVACCTDYEGRTKHSNAFRESIEEIWQGAILERRRRDMLEGRLLDVCARCQGLK